MTEFWLMLIAWLLAALIIYPQGRPRRRREGRATEMDRNDNNP